MHLGLSICLLSLICAVLPSRGPRSCRGRCDMGRVGSCYCNRHCHRHGDCCHDYRDVCVETDLQNRFQSSMETRDSCFDRCNIGRIGNCYCNNQCNRHGDCCHDYASSCSNVTSNTANTRRFLPILSVNATLTEIVSALWSSDTNRVPSADLRLNYQGAITRLGRGDRASRPLFAHVDESIFNRPTYRLFIRLLDNYNPDVNAFEHLSSSEENEIEDFIDAIVATNTMSVLREYLIHRGMIQHEIQAFKGLLRSLWFDLYRRRSRGVVSSSGFEHVMVGELRGSKVTGFHNWIQFYQEEKRGRLNYKGFLSKYEPNLLRAKMTWRGKEKEGASMFVGVSPEFDMAVYTLCIMLRPNMNCAFNFRGNNIRIRTFDNELVPGIQVGGAFVIL